MIWLIGHRGMLGSEISSVLREAGLDFIGSGSELSILDPAALEAFASGKGIGWIINCAAYTDVDSAEDHREACYGLNVDGPRILGSLASRIEARVIHFSSDYVFDGMAARPYIEDDPTSPLGVYGLSKSLGEESLRSVCPAHVIIRTSWLYGAKRANFVSTMLRLMFEKSDIGVVADQRGSPTYAADLASAVLSIVRAPMPAFGTYHFANIGEATRYEFAVEIRERGLEYGLLERPCRISPLTSAQYPTRAKRPAYSALSTEKIRRDYGLRIPDWRDSLRSFLRSLATEAFRQGAQPG